MLPFLKQHIWKIVVGILLALAVALGLSKRTADQPELNSNAIIQPQQTPAEFQHYYQQAQDLAGTNQPVKTTVSFLAVGDIMLSRNVAAEIQKNNNPDLPFQNMKDILASTNFNFGNLESPFTPPTKENMETFTQGIIGGHSLVFSAPPLNVKGLSDYHFKIVNLANNHAMDQNAAGMTYTRDLLKRNAISFTGTGNNLDEAWQPAVVDQNGLKICFIGASYASVNDSGKTTNTYVARIEDTNRLKSSLLVAKSECDFTVVTMHAGTEYTRNPNSDQIKFAHAAIDYGADMVIGAHPHWVQTIEKYCPSGPFSPSGGDVALATERVQLNQSPCPNPKYIFYSLGNFIFDQEWSQETKEGLALKIQISKSKTQNQAMPGAASIDDLQGTRIPAQLDSIELTPVILENYSTPRPATPEESKKILQKINQTETVLK